MRTFITIFAIATLLFVLGVRHLAKQQDESLQEQYELQEEKTQRPDPNRHVYSYDYLNKKFVYTDEVVPRSKWDDRNNPAPDPDFYVEGMNSEPAKQKAPEYITIEGQRFRVLYRSNGIVELEPY